MDIKKYIIIICILLFLPNVFALEKSFQLDIKYNVKNFEITDFEIENVSFKLTESLVSEVNFKEDNVFTFELSDQNEVIDSLSIAVPTMSYNDEPNPFETTKMSKTINLPYYSDAELLEIIDYQNQTITRITLPRLCNNNGECEQGENYETCSFDCSSYSKDNLCIDISDGKCDPDCPKGDDPDCKNRAYLLSIIALVLVIGIISAIFFLRKPKPHIKPHPELQSYVQNMLKQGYSREQIKLALLNAGHDKDLVNRLL